MLEGVTMIDPSTVYIEPGVTLGIDTTLWPGTYLHGSTQIGSGCVIGPDTSGTKLEAVEAFLERKRGQVRMTVAYDALDTTNAEPAAGVSTPRRTTNRADPRARFWVYGRGRQPCRRCGTPIRRDARGAATRVTYWCPRCQPSSLESIDPR